MQGTTHMIGGALSAAAYLCFMHPESIQSPPQIIAAVGIGAFGGLLPDIDHPKSIISQKLRLFHILASVISSHRGLFHAPLLYLALWSLQTWICNHSAYLVWSSLFFIGIASHLFLDFLTRGGITLFAPFNSKRRCIAKIKTGSKAECTIRLLLYVTCSVLLAALLLPSHLYFHYF